MRWGPVVLAVRRVSPGFHLGPGDFLADSFGEEGADGNNGP